MITFKDIIAQENTATTTSEKKHCEELRKCYSIATRGGEKCRCSEANFIEARKCYKAQKELLKVLLNRDLIGYKTTVRVANYKDLIIRQNVGTLNNSTYIYKYYFTDIKEI